MGLKSRFGNFLIFWGLISLFIFFASLYTPDKDYNYFAFLLGIVLLWIGIPLRRAKRPAPPKPAAPPPQAAPAPAKQAATAAKKRGLLTTLLKGPPPKTAAPPPLPPPPAAPPPPPKKGLAALFAPKPKKK